MRPRVHKSWVSLGVAIVVATFLCAGTLQLLGGAPNAGATLTVPVVIAKNAPAPPKSVGADCGLSFSRYTPSQLETDWTARVSPPFPIATEGLCALILREAGRWVPPLQTWITAALAVQRGVKSWGEPGSPTPAELAAMGDTLSAAHPSVLSALVYTDSCTGSTVTSHVSPLAGVLRDPRPVCARAEPTGWMAGGVTPHLHVKPGQTNQSTVFPGYLLQDKDYVLLDPLYLSAVSASLGASGAAAPHLHSRRRALLFDAGAGYWGSTSMSSVPWLLNEFAARGIWFDHIYAWEMTPHPGSRFFDGMPAEVVARTSFFNYPITAAVGSPANPFTVMKEVAKPGDFVVFKLDVDFPAVELPLVEQLRRDPELQALCDVFFFEHHVQNKDMAVSWRSQVKGTMLSSAKLFAELRGKGVAAQVWP